MPLRHFLSFTGFFSFLNLLYHATLCSYFQPLWHDDVNFVSRTYIVEHGNRRRVCTMGSKSLWYRICKLFAIIFIYLQLKFCEKIQMIWSPNGFMNLVSQIQIFFSKFGSCFDLLKRIFVWESKYTNNAKITIHFYRKQKQNQNPKNHNKHTIHGSKNHLMSSKFINTTLWGIWPQCGIASACKDT